MTNDILLSSALMTASGKPALSAHAHRLAPPASYALPLAPTSPPPPSYTSAFSL